MLSEFVIVKLAMPVPVKANPTRLNRFFAGGHVAPKSSTHKVLESRIRTSIQKTVNLADGLRARLAQAEGEPEEEFSELLYWAGKSLHYGSVAVERSESYAKVGAS